MPTITAQVRPDFTYDKGAPFDVEVPEGFEGTFALTYDPKQGKPGGLYTVVLYADRAASSVKLVFVDDDAILVDVPAGFGQSESKLKAVINTWQLNGGGNGGGAPGSVKTNP